MLSLALIRRSTLLLLLSQTTLAAPGALEEVLVTAQKRVQNVQEVPITINVVEGDTLNKLNVRTADDLANFVPGLTIQAAPQNLMNITIRGLGTQGGSETYDQSVGLFIDGVYAGRQRELQAALFDVERIEIIKGTQNALLGKNTSLGAVSLVTRKPGDSLGGFLQTDYEFEYGSYSAAGAIDVPIASSRFRLAINHVQEMGYVDNNATGNKVPEREQTTARITGVFTLGANGVLTAGYQYDDLSIRGDTFQMTRDDAGLITGDSVPLFFGFPGLEPNAEIGLNFDKAAYMSFGKDGDANDEQSTDRAYLNYDHSFGDYGFTSLTGWSRYDNQRAIDSDFLQGDYLNSTSDGDYEQFSQEFRLASPQDNRFNYLLGVFYLHSEFTLVDVTDANFPFPPIGLPTPTGILEIDGGSSKNYSQDTDVLSIFGQGTWAFTDKLRATVGLRWTDENKRADFASVETRPGPAVGVIRPLFPATDLSRDEQNLDGSINLQYDLSDSVMSYASWAQGTKSGGFSLEVDRPEQSEYETEVAQTSELGLKTVLAGGLATFNTALFYTTIDDFQIAQFNGLGFDIATIPATSKGAELEAAWLVSRGLSMSGGVTYADATEDDTGKQLNHSPKWSANLALHYETPVLERVLFSIDGNIAYIGKRYAHLGETFPMDAITPIDLRLALSTLDSRWELAMVGRNLTSEEVSFQFDFPFLGGLAPGTTEIGSINRPRTIALQLTMNF